MFKKTERGSERVGGMEEKEGEGHSRSVVLPVFTVVLFHPGYNLPFPARNYGSI